MSDTLQDIVSIIKDVVGDHIEVNGPITRDMSINSDLELESIDLVVISEKIQNRFGDAVDFTGWLSGMEMDDLELLIHGNELTIKGERKKPELKDASWRRRERGFGRFSRVLELPDDVDAEKVEAHFRNGVLLIELPKREEAKPRRIEVKAN